MDTGNKLWCHPAWLGESGCDKGLVILGNEPTVPTKERRLPILVRRGAGVELRSKITARNAFEVSFVWVWVWVWVWSSSCSGAATPRSPSNTVPLSSMRRFAALISRWIKPLTCK